MNDNSSLTIGVPSLQFYWRLKESITNKNIVPDFLPYYMTYDDTLNLVVQKKQKIVIENLSKIYREEPHIGNIQPNSTWANMYKNDFLDFIVEFLPRNKSSTILEIGCGGCLVLSELSKRGHKVTGLDPSIFSVNVGKSLGLKIIQDFFPSKKLTQKFDVIFHSDVLEHIVEPKEFLHQVFAQLQDEGIMILAVPDNELNFKTGDVSIFLHQHMNYFDRISLKHLIESVGFSNVKIQAASFGGSLYCVAVKTKKPAESTTSTSYKAVFQNFIKKADDNINRIKKYVDSTVKNNNRTLGFYAPIRTLPYLSFLQLYNKFRFFDDTEFWHKKYLDGIDIPIENFKDLYTNPVTDLIIMSPTFGTAIKSKVEKKLSGKIDIKTLSDFLSV